MNPFVKSIVWLVSCGGIGYVLLELTKPNESKLRAIRESAAGSSSLTEEQRRKELFLQKFKQTTEAKPIYVENSKTKNEK